eukprot:TRINITY_DN5024_c0_g1_i5.p1 TRINITY_DN5024_c0_g1~~TRINITY_DN5024_c0_g1_i5.p1  ORF type:complete len:139 (+),score=45.49 TRINITY_DN5024_c0_g1_i5:63-479(+)
MNDVKVEEELTEIEIQKCREAFNAFDKDGSGTIDPEELRNVLEEMGQKPTEEDVLKMINEVDQSNRGVIEFKDFLRAMARQKRMQREREDESDIRDAFDALKGDDGRSSIDAKKLIHIIKDEFNLTIDIEVIFSSNFL